MAPMSRWAKLAAKSSKNEKNIISELRISAMLLILREKRVTDKTLPWGTPISWGKE